MSVLVKFPMSQANWNKLVVDTPVSVVVEEENSNTFTLEYESENDFNEVVTMLDGSVEYTKLKETAKANEKLNIN